MSKCMIEGHSRSVTKSILWRIMGVMVLALITYMVTRNVIVTTVLTVVYHGVCVLGYYVHERLWFWIDRHLTTRFRPILRVIVYELGFGVFTLGIISWLVTGQVKQASVVTVVYIGNKLWMYVAYDKIWERISWNRTIVLE